MVAFPEIRPLVRRVEAPKTDWLPVRTDCDLTGGRAAHATSSITVFALVSTSNDVTVMAKSGWRCGTARKLGIRSSPPAVLVSIRYVIDPT